MKVRILNLVESMFNPRCSLHRSKQNNGGHNLRFHTNLFHRLMVLVHYFVGLIEYFLLLFLQISGIFLEPILSFVLGFVLHQSYNFQPLVQDLDLLDHIQMLIVTLRKVNINDLRVPFVRKAHKVQYLVRGLPGDIL